MSRRRTRTRTTAPHRPRAAAVGAAATLVGGAGSALLLALSATSAPATVSGTFTVDTVDDGTANATDCTTPVADSCSLRDALAAAAPGETITFAPALFAGGPRTITLDPFEGKLVGSEVDIVGPGSGLLTLDALYNSPVLWVDTAVSGTTISGLTITHGVDTVTGGGGIRDNAYNLLVLEDVVVSHNRTTGTWGAGIVGGGLRLVDSVVRDNTASTGGGGIVALGATYIRNSTIADNTSYNCGGALYFGGADSTLTVLGSTFSGNSTTVCYGGAIDVDGNGNVVTIADSTFTANSAPLGGALNADTSNTIRIAMTTITGNVATSTDPYYSGGGIHLQFYLTTTPTLEMTGVVLAGNTAGTGGAPDLGVGGTAHGPTTVSAASSFVGTVSANVTVTGSGLQRGADPRLGPLADNGGPTATMLPLAGSPLLDAGPATVPDFPGNAYDQRGPGFPRTSGPASDIGAVEVTIPPEPEPSFTG